MRTADQITKYSDAAPIARDQLVVGDMIGFSHTPGGYVDHIGVYAGTDAAGHPIMCMHPMLVGVVEETRLDTPYWQGMDVVADSPGGVRWTQVCMQWG